MAKKPDVIMIERSGRDQLKISTADGRQIAAENRARDEARRRGRTVYRLRRHLYPWWAAAVLMAIALVTWAIRALTDLATAVSVAAIAAIVTAFVGWLIGRQTARWQRRVYVATGVAALWLVYAAYRGPSWWPVLLLVAATEMLAARWWKAIRIPHPTAPKPPQPEKDAGPIYQRWATYVGDRGCVLPGSKLTDQDTTHKNREVYTVQLVPGKQTFGTALSGLELIASGLDTPFRNLVLEPHPDESPTRLRLTVVSRSPIKETVEYQGPRVHDGIIDIGPYGDGEGYAPWRLWTPGEASVPDSGSWWGGGIFAGMGSGKSRLIELLSIGAVSTGYCVVWFIDPQGGASSPALARAADWYVDLDGAPVMLTALERIVKWRGKEMDDEGWIGFDPSPQRPGINVVIDEGHEVLGRNTNRWKDLARKSRKVGVGITLVSQYPGLDTFGGSEPLRAAILAGNIVAMRAESNQNGQLIPGLDVDPKTLPELPGFGYTVRRKGAFGRTAPYRAEYVADPGAWLARYPSPELDQLAANAAGDVYLGRHEAMARARKQAAAEVEAMRRGQQRPLPIEVKAEPTERPVPGVPDFPKPPTLHVVPEVEEPPTATDNSRGRDRIIDTLKKGPTSPEILRQCTGLKETRVRVLLEELIEDRRVVKVRHGVYRLTDTA